MYIKRYTIAAATFMVLVGWYVYAFVTQQAVSLDIFGLHFPSLPVAFWIILPVLFLYLASVAHMAYYSFVGSFKLRKYQKDFEKLSESLRDAFLAKENRAHQYKTERYAMLGKLIDQSTVIPSESLLSVGDEKIDAVLGLLEKIKEGTPVDLKKHGLDKENPLMIQNDLNRLEKEELNSEDVLTRQDRYGSAVVAQAFAQFVEHAPLYAIEKYKSFMGKETLFSVLSRVNADENTLEVANETLIDFIESVELDEQEFIKAASILGVNMLPDQRMKLFEVLSEHNEEAMGGYLYTLFDLEMIAPADEILENSQPNEFVYFKAYRALKECNKPYNISLFVQ